MTEVTRHFTATTFIVYEDKTLLHFHKSLEMWLPPGGHIERDELPHEAAVREVKEETGLDVELAATRGNREGLKTESVRVLPPPRYILLENINPHHQHIDHIYFARARHDVTRPREGEAIRMEWYTEEDIEDHPELTEDIRSLAAEAIRTLGS